MTFTFESSMFTKEVVLALVSHPCGFSFYKSETGFGDYHIHIQITGSPERNEGIEMIRAMVRKQGQSAREADDYNQPSRD